MFINIMHTYAKDTRYIYDINVCVRVCVCLLQKMILINKMWPAVFVYNNKLDVLARHKYVSVRACVCVRVIENSY